MRIPFLDLHAQYLSIKEEIDAAIAGVLQTSAFIGGPRVAAFESAFAGYLSAGACVGVANGTDALEIALEALELPPGSEVIVPCNTFMATAEAVTRSGHRVVFCDCDPDSYTISVADAQRRITPATRAIIPVHLYGQPCDMEPLLELARRHGLRVIEDCAQAHGASYRGRRVGTFGDAATFSFYPGKNLGAYGDAGAIVSCDDAIAAKARKIANHGRTEKYQHEMEGRNSRLDGLQAAVLSVKLWHLEGWTEARRAHASLYRSLLSDAAVTTPAEHPQTRHVYHLFVIQAADREGLQAALKRAGIECGIHYPLPLHLQPAYRHLGHAPGDFPVAERAAERILSLPLFPELTGEQVAFVCQEIKKAL